jgi:hypothetical protein
VKKLEREALLADRDAVSRILHTVSNEDILGRMSFESRLKEIDKQIEALDRSAASPVGKVALLLGGRSVYGSRAIDTDFASDVLKSYQDIVAKRIAHDEIGPLASRGPIPFHTETKLAITDVVRGSVGFVLEEFAENLTLVETAVKQAIEDVTTLLHHTAAEQEESFETAVESLDPRLLASLKTFFATLDDHQATIRIVDDRRDESLDRTAVRRARDRVDHTEIDERDEEEFTGRLVGVVPHARRFEMQLDDGELIYGTVAGTVSNKYHELISDPGQAPVGRRWRVKMRIRQIRERNKPDRNVYTLLGLLRRLRG